MKQATRDFIEIWTSRLKKESEDVDFADEEDRATFRGRIFEATRSASWDVLRRIASMLGEHDVPRSRDRTIRIIVNSWIVQMQLQGPKKVERSKTSPAQLDREIRKAVAVSDAEINAFLETLDVTRDPEDQRMVDDAFSAIMGDDKARGRLTAIIRNLG